MPPAISTVRWIVDPYSDGVEHDAGDEEETERAEERQQAATRGLHVVGIVFALPANGSAAPYSGGGGPGAKNLRS